jgi:hypothetical protein
MVNGLDGARDANVAMRLLMLGASILVILVADWLCVTMEH